MANEVQMTMDEEDEEGEQLDKGKGKGGQFIRAARNAKYRKKYTGLRKDRENEQPTTHDVDQVPFALDNNPDSTFVSAADTELVQISGQPGADKRKGKASDDGKGEETGKGKASDDGKGKDEASDDGKGEETGKGKASDDGKGKDEVDTRTQAQGRHKRRRWARGTLVVVGADDEGETDTTASATASVSRQSHLARTLRVAAARQRAKTRAPAGAIANGLRDAVDEGWGAMLFF
jgi:hypothetical protein